MNSVRAGILRCMDGTTPVIPVASAIGIELRKAREAAELSLRELARELEVSHTTLGRWETGVRMPRLEDVAMVLGKLGVVGARFDELIDLARRGNQHQWLSLGATEQQRQLGALVQFEANAVSIMSVEPLLIPGMLQTADYARTIMTTARIDPSEVEMRIVVRMGRRDVLIRPTPPRYLALIGEMALRLNIGGAGVMRRQLAQLLEVAQWPAVELRVVPMSAGWHPGLQGPMTIVEPADGDPVVHIETAALGLFLHESKDTAGHRLAADMVLQSALDKIASTELIADIMDALDSEGSQCELEEVH